MPRLKIYCRTRRDKKVMHEDMVFLQLCKFSKQSASLEETGARKQWRRIPGLTHTLQSEKAGPE